MATTRDIFSIDAKLFDAKFRYMGHSIAEKFVVNRPKGSPREQEIHKVSGLPMWKIQVYVENYGLADIKVPYASEPQYSALDYLDFTNLRVGATNAGRLWFNADSVSLDV